jgi:hypothetical protein
MFCDISYRPLRGTNVSQIVDFRAPLAVISNHNPFSSEIIIIDLSDKYTESYDIILCPMKLGQILYTNIL